MPRLFISIFSIFAFALTAQAWTPGTANSGAVSGFTVNTADRRDVLAYYQCVYNASGNYASNIAWTGDLLTGVAGTTSPTFKNDVLRRINFYRALVSLPSDITFDATKSVKNQEAALMFAANSEISHFPPNTWTYYTANAAEAAGKSNIALGTYGPESVDAYIEDEGDNNRVVGHRRWLLYSRAQQMGTGDVPPTGGFMAANAIWVFGDFKAAPAPSFIAWPNAGYTPLSLLPARWSLSYPGANFGNATVIMTQAGVNVPLSIISKTDNGYGDNTIVWEPEDLPRTLTADLPYSITVSGISGNGVPTSRNYTVTVFDPNVLGESITISGSANPASTGGTYTFNAIAQADAYQLNIANHQTTPWTEGAEDATSAQIISSVSPALNLRQNSIVRSGGKSFQLAFPDFLLDAQSFVLDRDIVPTVSSQLQFYDRFRWVTTTTRLSAEISTDAGTTWTELWGRTGNGNQSSSGWETVFTNRSISLAAYAGQVVRLRFILRHNYGNTFIGSNSNFGAFIDDISVSNSGQLVNATLTTLPGTAQGFTLNSTTAGGSLSAGTNYFMRVRPQVGTHWVSYGSPKIVSPQSLSGFALYVRTQYPMLSGVPTADYDLDGLADLAEYAFGTSPTVRTVYTSLPMATLNNGQLSINYTGTASGVSYGAQMSTDLVTWQDLTNTGTGAQHSFATAWNGQPQLFLRHKITLTP